MPADCARATAGAAREPASNVRRRLRLVMVRVPKFGWPTGFRLVGMSIIFRGGGKGGKSEEFAPAIEGHHPARAGCAGLAGMTDCLRVCCVRRVMYFMAVLPCST